MSRILAVLAVLAFGLPIAAPGAAAAPLSENRVIVQWAPGADRGERVAARAEADVSFDRTLGDSDFQTVDVGDGQSVGDAIAALEADPAVLVAEPDGWSEPQAVPDDPLFGQLWGLRNPGGAFGVAGFPAPRAGADIDVLGAWLRTVGTPSTVVAVIDSGYRFGHPDLGPVAWTNADEIDGNGEDDDDNGFVDDRRGYDFIGANGDSPTTDDDPSDDNFASGGHGIHVAGTVGAKGDNGVGVVGVAQDVRIMPLRVCSYRPSGLGGCLHSSIVAAINYAGANGARAANISLGGGSFSQTMVNALAANSQTLFVVSAGNDGIDAEAVHQYPCTYRPTVDADPPVPGAVDNVVCVAATDQRDALASFSNYSAVGVDLGAPGTETLSADPAVDSYSDSFEIDDFATKWTATGPDGGFARAKESWSPSFQMNDTPNVPPTAGTVRESTSAPIVLPAGFGGCSYSQTRWGSPGSGNQYSYAILLDGEVVFEASPGPGQSGNTSGPIPELSAGGSVRIRQTYSVSTGGGLVGVWLDDLRLRCFGAASSTAATFGFKQGTSMAAPHVTGAAALLFSQRPEATVTEVRDALLGGVDLLPALAGKTVTGGRLDVSKAIDAFDSDAPAAPQLAVVPAGPANDNGPRVTGSAEERSQVALYASAGCAGAPVANAGAATLAAPGIAVTVADDSTTAFSATATDTAGNVSSCSAPVSYTESTPPVVVDPPIVTDPIDPPVTPGPLVGGPILGGGPSVPVLERCKVPRLAGRSLARARAALARANCRLGRVTKPRKRRGQRRLPPLVVRSSRPGAGAELATGAKVAVTLGPKPSRRKRS